MLVSGSIGLQVLLVFVVFPVIYLVIRRKWRLSVARKEEINRLLVLSSEEAFRAELEASAGYTYTSITPLGHQCAVCYSTTTTRCARCKAVRYWYVYHPSSILGTVNLLFLGLNLFYFLLISLSPHRMSFRSGPF